MPQRPSLQGMMPGMPMTGSGTSGEMFDDSDPSMQMMQMESPETRRRRLTPAVGYPQPQPSTLDQLLTMLRGGQ